MAARMLQKRIGSLLFRDHPSLTQAIKEQSVPSVYSIFSRFQLGKRDIQTETKPANLTNEDPKLENHEADSLKPSCDSDDQSSHSSAGKVVEIKMHAEYNLKTSPRHDLCMVFTCTVCNTRTMKTASREAYEKGVVVARCNGCDNLHLFADHLGMFGEKCTVEDFLAARGEEVKKGTTDSLNLTIEDLAGKDFAGKKVAYNISSHFKFCVVMSKICGSYLSKHLCRDLMT